MHYLNATAALVLELSDGVQTAEAIALEMQKACTLDASPISQVDACLATLASAGLIVPVEPQP